jgi:hypothetical protein
VHNFKKVWSLKLPAKIKTFCGEWCGGEFWVEIILRNNGWDGDTHCMSCVVDDSINHILLLGLFGEFFNFLLIFHNLAAL